ncbi:hypothetical protein BP5796_04429 [Coleophoma crateriformis]|uniref:Uncharacterized protein n=1 Tax=Coleophoma crateriformis TaxID=565419 RepID=A0A3D8SAY8_9HELO|nr:hypothetical protein BP5796_04429 [Coleophoma crateriformis]
MRSNSCAGVEFWADTEFPSMVLTLISYQKKTATIKQEIPSISKKVKFTAALKFNDSRQLYRPIDLSQPQYVGTPSAEIDANWENLNGGQ